MSQRNATYDAAKVSCVQSSLPFRKECCKKVKKTEKEALAILSGHSVLIRFKKVTRFDQKKFKKINEIGSEDELLTQAHHFACDFAGNLLNHQIQNRNIFF